KHSISLKISLEEPWPWWKSGNISQLKFTGGSNTNPINSELSKALLSRKKTSLPILSELPDSLKRTSYIFEKGNWTAHGKEVIPGIPEIFNQDGKSFENRREMGKWLASNKNPLTARVIVNRVWEQLFGAGIVATTSDFGAMGTPPTHPLLLDWLSVKFMNEWNWSLKKLIREIVLSSTYKQSSVISSEKREKDPSNKWLSRGARFRLSAEQTRDQLLAISGLLSNKMYGPSVMPPQPDNVWSIVYSGADWTESKGEDRYRRAIYTYWRRTSPYPSMSSFDSPSREYCVSQRIRTNTPLQALVMLNDTVSIEAAQHLASNAIHSTQDNSTRAIINNMYTKAIGISPDSNVLNTLEKLYEEALEEFGRSAEQVNDFVFINTKLNKDLPEFAALSVTANAILNLDAFIMKY
ncbi:MAG: DUF1553 domain-containing protein, partial [Cyclobacteriaceae bacterium]|nr:DUF1553 domain-containing protein [Cyclobacteriaceae bacterium]